MLSNGVETRLYRWDVETPILTLDFTDFVSGNTKFEDLKRRLSPTVFTSSGATAATASPRTDASSRTAARRADGRQL